MSPHRDIISYLGRQWDRLFYLARDADSGGEGGCGTGLWVLRGDAGWCGEVIMPHPLIP